MQEQKWGLEWKFMEKLKFLYIEREKMRTRKIQAVAFREDTHWPFSDDDNTSTNWNLHFLNHNTDYGGNQNVQVWTCNLNSQIYIDSPLLRTHRNYTYIIYQDIIVAEGHFLEHAEDMLTIRYLAQRRVNIMEESPVDVLVCESSEVNFIPSVYSENTISRTINF